MTGEADEHWLHDPVGNPSQLTNSDEEDVCKGGRDGEVVRCVGWIKVQSCLLRQRSIVVNDGKCFAP